MNAITEIMRFQTDRELDKKEYDALNEHTNIIEELLESIKYDVPKANRLLLSEEVRSFMTSIQNKGIAHPVVYKSDIEEEEAIIDAYCDVIVFCIGSIMKLGYSPNIALIETAMEINSREGEIVNGKFEKYLTDEYKAKWYKANYSKAKNKG